MTTHQLLRNGGTLREGEGDGLGRELLGEDLLDEGRGVRLGDLDLGGREDARGAGHVDNVDDRLWDVDLPLFGDEGVALGALVGRDGLPGLSRHSVCK